MCSIFTASYVLLVWVLLCSVSSVWGCSLPVPWASSVVQIPHNENWFSISHTSAKGSLLYEEGYQIMSVACHSSMAMVQCPLFASQCCWYMCKSRCFQAAACLDQVISTLTTNHVGKCTVLNTNTKWVYFPSGLGGSSERALSVAMNL